MKKLAKGLLIVFEGIDGTGKSTQLQLAGQFLKANNYDIITTREPTSGTYGDKIRSLYQDRGAVSLEEELELFLADRKEHVQTLIAPSLALGKIILCDRYFLSTAAYQGAAGLDPDEIIERNRFAPQPDLALIFELEASESIRRITEKRRDALNDFEQLGSLKKVAAVFKNMPFSYIKRIDASGSIVQVSQTVIKHVTDILP